MKLSNADRNVIRTAMPSVVGAVVSYLVKIEAHLTPAEIAVVFPVATTAYYTVIRTLEEKYPKASWLLGCLPVKAESIPAVDVHPATK